MTLFDELRAEGAIAPSGRLLPTAEDAAILRRRLRRLMAEASTDRIVTALRNACGDYLEEAPVVATSRYLNRRRRELAELER